MYCAGEAEERRRWLRISELKISARLRECKFCILSFEFLISSFEFSILNLQLLISFWIMVFALLILNCGFWILKFSFRTRDQRLKIACSDLARYESNFSILFALQYNNKFHYLYFRPPEIPPATRSIGKFCVRHVQGNQCHVVSHTVPYDVTSVSYDVKFLSIVRQAGSNSRHFSAIGKNKVNKSYVWNIIFWNSNTTVLL